jgi:hypothetical protein
MQTLGSEYQALASAAGSGISLAQLKGQTKNLDTTGKTGAAFRQLVQYMITACH